MSESVCLECGAEMPYDWAPCPQCGWKVPDAWEAEETGETIGPSQGLLSKPQPWIGITAWVVIALLVFGFLFYLHLF